MNWINRKINMPPLGERILIFFPAYPEGHPDRIRLIDSMFYKIMRTATHWATIDDPSDDAELM